MRLAEFGYDLPEDLIAQHPMKERDQARLMVLDRRTQSITHDYFYNLNKYLPRESVLVFNNSKVVPARLLGVKKRTGGSVEIFLLKKQADGQSFETLMRPMRKIKDGDEIIFAKTDLRAFVVDKEKRLVRFNRPDVVRYLEHVGHIPLPPYIKRADDQDDREFYQTVFARYYGSVAAPTAGLHFTKGLLTSLKQAGHVTQNVTLHINYATFKPVEAADITQHEMHTEQYSVSQKTRAFLQQAKRKKRSIVAVGTTSTRVLESVAAHNRLKGQTRLFIYPGYNFKMVDALITNFHLPFSSLLMLVYAFGGTDFVKKAYQEAIRKKYRFYSYGDGMVIV